MSPLFILGGNAIISLNKTKEYQVTKDMVMFLAESKYMIKNQSECFKNGQKDIPGFGITNTFSIKQEMSLIDKIYNIIRDIYLDNKLN